MIQHILHRYICSQSHLWRSLGDIETKWLRPKLKNVVLENPIYITGLARSGTSIMLEMLAEVEGVVTHTYRDFPLVFTPYCVRWCFRIGDFFSWKKVKKKERAHQDRLFVTPKSPESMEEMIWMAFFKTLHDESKSNVMTQRMSKSKFEAFYRAHLQKLLYVERAQHYVSKANYNITRIGYLLKLFPKARFVVMVREPKAHVASLMKQEKLFFLKQRKQFSTVKHMQLSGHFEFGVGRKLIHVGDNEAMSEIQAAFAAGEDVRGWALYWRSMYRFVHEQLNANILLVDYDQLCTHPKEQLERILYFCGLQTSEEHIKIMAQHLSKPSYYEVNFSTQEQQMIDALTLDTYTNLLTIINH